MSNFQSYFIEERLRILEEHVFKKKKRLRATEAQKCLIAYHLKLIDSIKQLDLSQNQKDLIVSVVLDIDLNNAKKFLSETNKKVRPLLNTVSNYTFLSDFFDKVPDKKISLEVDKILTSIKTDQERSS